MQRAVKIPPRRFPKVDLPPMYLKGILAVKTPLGLRLHRLEIHLAKHLQQ